MPPAIGDTIKLQQPSALYPYAESATRDLGAIFREVERGLPNEYRPRIDDAIKNVNYYNGDTAQYIAYRDAESTWDHDERPKRTSNLTRRVVEVLCEHLYDPGPSRKVGASDAADAWLSEVYAANHVNAKFREADRLATLNDVAAFQVAAAGVQPTLTDDAADNASAAPLRVHLLGSEEFAAWTDPDDPTRPWAVCTITRYNERKRFQLWTKEAYWTFYTAQLAIGQTAGGRTARYAPDESGENPYGVLPFSFVHYCMPTRDFWTPGPGTAIRKGHAYLDQAMSDLANAMSLYCSPQAFAYNVRSDWKPLIRPGGITHVPGSTDLMAAGMEPRIEYLQPQVDVSGQWEDLGNFRDTLLEDHGVPRSAIRMEQTSMASGVAIVAEQAPLLTRAKGRRPMFNYFESELARVCLAVAGAYYGKAELLEASLDPQLQCTWPDPEIPIPGPDENQNDEWETANGYTSEVKVMMRRRGFTREQAVAELEEVMEDRRMVEDLKRRYQLDQTSQMVAQQRALAEATPAAGGEGEGEGEGEDDLSPGANDEDDGP